MIKELRIDDRLIHGQVALTWPHALGINHIIVANDNAFNDETQQVTLKMAVQGDTKVLIRSINDTIQFLENPRVKKIPLMLIVNCVNDAIKIYQSFGKDYIERINVANVGRFDEISNEKKKKLASTIFITPEAIEKLLIIVNDGENIVNQVVPEKKSIPFEELIKR